PSPAEQPAAGRPEASPAPQATPARRRRRAASSDGSSAPIQTLEATAGSGSGHRFSASVADAADRAGTAGAQDGTSAEQAVSGPTIIGVGVKAEDITRSE
ncbi:MAG TPA: hypothetical protein VIG75_11765, partial [Citricoccus sp.]